MLKGYKTIIWNVIGYLPVVMAMTEQQYAIPDAWAGWWLLLFITVNIILRIKTDTAVGSKE
tara:strand:+ start:114 stop:296 length:183 start_codon:yes stop_codon:yes gene_type:complete